MIKFKADNFLGFGLSEDNIKKLKEGKLIKINMDEMGFLGQNILIFYEKQRKICNEI